MAISSQINLLRNLASNNTVRSHRQRCERRSTSQQPPQHQQILEPPQQPCSLERTATNIRTTTSVVFKGTQKKRHHRTSKKVVKIQSSTTVALKQIAGKTNDFQTPTTQRPLLETEAVLVESETNGADRREIRTEGGAEGRCRSSHHRCKTLHLGGRRVWINGVRRRKQREGRAKISRERRGLGGRVTFE